MNDVQPITAPVLAIAPPIKALFMGESGSGKTCALASLLDAGYQVRVLDLDNGIDTLKHLLTSEKSKYKKDCLSRLSYITLTEPMRFAQGRIIPAKATVWQSAMTMLDKWSNSKAELGTICDLGSASKWGPDTVLVIDTMSTLSNAALNFHLAMQGALGAVRSQNEGRRDIGVAQQLIRTLCQYLSDVSLRCNVLVNCHIVYVKQDGSGDLTPGEKAPTQGFPAAIGRALSPEIPRYFNAVLLCASAGGQRKVIHTMTQANINLKTTAPHSIAPMYEQPTGLAEYFRAVRGLLP
jgi:hypothetical protein